MDEEEILPNSEEERAPSNNAQSEDLEAEGRLVFYPQVPQKHKPKKGQEFSNLDEVLDFYNFYAKEAGFSVRKSSTKINSDTGEIIRKEYLCHKEGKPSVSVATSRRRGTIREGCLAKLVVVKPKSNNFVVTIFEEGHNHHLSTPSKIHLLNSHRKVSEAKRALIHQMEEVNIPTHKQYDLMAAQSGGFENIGCTQTDLYNYKRDLEKNMKGRDGTLFHEILMMEQGKNPSFYFKIESDHEKRITRCFWADATSRRNYTIYGDVVIFDTTYCTNRYGLIFAPILGVNNHGQTIIFASAFLSGETADDFVWFFEQFLKAMPGDAPKMIITDQDPSMAIAIPQVLKTTFHRYCIWHITTKFSVKLDAVKYKLFYSEFKNCIWNSRTEEAFESTWKELVQRSGLTDNKWLDSIFNIRAKWVPVYMKQVFSAGMTSSQRAESAHSFLKMYVDSYNLLIEFIVRFFRSLQKQRHEALILDNKDVISNPQLKMAKNPILVQLVNLYTEVKFYEFEKEFLESFSYLYKSVDETQGVYKTQRKCMKTDEGRLVFYEKERDFVRCSCSIFDSTGIPCRHMLGYLHKFTDFEELPAQYILKRWMKTMNSGIVIDREGMEVVEDKFFFMDRSRLIHRCLSIIDKALTSPEAKDVLLKDLDDTEEKINSLVSSRTSGKRTKKAVDCGASVERTESSVCCDDEPTYLAPNQVRFKGCGTAKRFKGGKELAVQNANEPIGKICNGCRLYGQKHNIRTCPVHIAKLKAEAEKLAARSQVEDPSLSQP